MPNQAGVSHLLSIGLKKLCTHLMKFFIIVSINVDSEPEGTIIINIPSFTSELMEFLFYSFQRYLPDSLGVNLFNAYYPLIISGFSVIICFWAEVS